MFHRIIWVVPISQTVGANEELLGFVKKVLLALGESAHARERRRAQRRALRFIILVVQVSMYGTKQGISILRIPRKSQENNASSSLHRK